MYNHLANQVTRVPLKPVEADGRDGRQVWTERRRSRMAGEYLKGKKPGGVRLARIFACHWLFFLPFGGTQ
jgi:hypothetical protein